MNLIQQHQQNPAERILQKTLAQQVTIFVQGEEEYNKAIETTAKLFSQQHVAASEHEH